MSTTTTTASSATTTTTTTTTSTAPSRTSVQLTGPYELYCFTSLVQFVMNDVTTSATITPADPQPGQQFELTDYQTQTVVPQRVIAAAEVIEPQLSGALTGQLDTTGATPATTPVGPLGFSGISTTQVPASGVPLSLPSTPETLGPFTATSAAITVQQDTSVTFTLDEDGTPFVSLFCTAYPNDTVPTSGNTNSAPSAKDIFPVIAVAGGGGTPIPPGTSSLIPPPPASSIPISIATVGLQTVPAQASNLAFTGTGRGTWLIGFVGVLLVVTGIAILVLVDVPRMLLARFASAVHKHKHVQ